MIQDQSMRAFDLHKEVWWGVGLGAGLEDTTKQNAFSLHTAAVFVSRTPPNPTPFEKITSRSPLLRPSLEGRQMGLRFDFTSVFCTVASWVGLAQVEGGVLSLFSDRIFLLGHDPGGVELNLSLSLIRRCGRRRS